jgi:deoxyribose-phosphate aldolase
MAISEGAQELDMVLDLALVRSHHWSQVRADIEAVRAAAPTATLKVVIEAGAIKHDEIIGACRAAEEAGAQFVKTSTGFHPAGGATTGHVRLMTNTVDRRLGVKASGGIRNAPAALSMLRAGATRLGLSGTRAVLADLPTDQ